MRISDWSSDVCSSDLLHPDRKCGEAVLQVLAKGPAVPRVQQYRGERVIDASALLFAAVDHILEPIECLHDSHCRAASTIEAARSGGLDGDFLVSERDRFLCTLHQTTPPPHPHPFH